MIMTFEKLFDELTRTPSFGHFDAMGSYYVMEEDGKKKLLVNVLGHEPKNIDVEVAESELTITANRNENSNPFVKNIDLKFTIGRDYDGTKSEALVENGILTLLIDKKEDKKSKRLKLRF
jgi:HSP20 family molecular chaperone IbpA